MITMDTEIDKLTQLLLNFGKSDDELATEAQDRKEREDVARLLEQIDSERLIRREIYLKRPFTKGREKPRRWWDSVVRERQLQERVESYLREPGERFNDEERERWLLEIDNEVRPLRAFLGDA